MGAFKKYDKSRGGKSFGGSKFGGGRKFGGRSDDRGDGPKQLFDATCSDCNRDCQVPFRPSGGNPVFCRDCFRKQEGSSSSFSPKKSFGGNSAGRSFGNDGGSSNGITKAQFDVLSMKLDKVLSLLRNGSADETEFEEKPSRILAVKHDAPVRKARGKRNVRK